MAKKRTSIRLEVRPEEAIRHVREVVDAHPSWRVQGQRGKSMAVTDKGSEFAKSPKVEVSAKADGGATVVSLAGTVVGFGPNQRRLDQLVAELEDGLRAMSRGT